MSASLASRPTAPKASIIIRSVGRKELTEALATVAAQTYPVIEVVVVDATGGAHPLLPALCGDFPVVFVPGSERRSRAVAANAGLDAAHGQYIGFLDDDDLIEPTHVAGLVAALEANPEYGVAYAHAREIDTDGALIRRRSERYSRFVLFQECFIQPSAVLFRRAIRDCCRFDERFEVCEDWDFWLQAATMTDFLEVPQETAIYRSALGRSGTGQGPNRDLSQFRRFHAMIAAKWHAEGARLAGVVLPALDAEYERACELFRVGRRDEARKVGQSILEEYPHHLGARNLCGTIDALAEDFVSAAAHFQWAASVEPGDPAAHFNWAQALERLGRLDEARERYLRVLVLEPTHRHARARLASLEHH